MRIGIVGNGSDKFTPLGEERARRLIAELLESHNAEYNPVILVSGRSPVGGIDIWAEEEAATLGFSSDIFVPKINQWNPDGYGYKARNLDIAASDIVYCIVADVYPDEYKGRKFKLCYHDGRVDHVKSGGCWTLKQALKMGNKGELLIVQNYD